MKTTLSFLTLLLAAGLAAASEYQVSQTIASGGDAAFGLEYRTENGDGILYYYTRTNPGVESTNGMVNRYNTVTSSTTVENTASVDSFDCRGFAVAFSWEGAGLTYYRAAYSADGNWYRDYVQRHRVGVDSAWVDGSDAGNYAYVTEIDAINNSSVAQPPAWTSYASSNVIERRSSLDDRWGDTIDYSFTAEATTSYSGLTVVSDDGTNSVIHLLSGKTIYLYTFNYDTQVATFDGTSSITIDDDSLWGLEYAYEDVHGNSVYYVSSTSGSVYQITAVPEPMSLGLLSVGLLAFLRKRSFNA